MKRTSLRATSALALAVVAGGIALPSAVAVELPAPETAQTATLFAAAETGTTATPKPPVPTPYLSLNEDGTVNANFPVASGNAEGMAYGHPFFVTSDAVRFHSTQANVEGWFYNGTAVNVGDTVTFTDGDLTAEFTVGGTQGGTPEETDMLVLNPVGDITFELGATVEEAPDPDNLTNPAAAPDTLEVADQVATIDVLANDTVDDGYTAENFYFIGEEGERFGSAPFVGKGWVQIVGNEFVFTPELDSQPTEPLTLTYGWTQVAEDGTVGGSAESTVTFAPATTATPEDPTDETPAPPVTDPVETPAPPVEELPDPTPVTPETPVIETPATPETPTTPVDVTDGETVTNPTDGGVEPVIVGTTPTNGDVAPAADEVTPVNEVVSSTDDFAFDGAPVVTGESTDGAYYEDCDAAYAAGTGSFIEGVHAEYRSDLDVPYNGVACEEKPYAGDATASGETASLADTGAGVGVLGLGGLLTALGAAGARFGRKRNA